MKPRIAALFGERYPKRHFAPTSLRSAYALATGSDEGGVPYAGLINPDNPPSGPYGGTSVVWFPTSDESLISFVVGTRGLAPDEGILTRPGHRRRITALRRYLARRGIECWTKPDPSALGVSVPKSAMDRFPGFEKAFKRYGAELYACARVPKDPEPVHLASTDWFQISSSFGARRFTSSTQSTRHTSQSSMNTGGIALRPTSVRPIERTFTKCSRMPVCMRLMR